MLEQNLILDGMYRIIKEIGRGGTGIIYLAEHLRLKKYVVVKKIKDDFAGQVNGRIEVDILKRLHHSYLPQVYDFLVVNQSIYTVMEYVEGNDLQYYVNQNYQFNEETLRAWLFQLTDVLEYLHSQKMPILHSDIKPGNIMVTKEGNVCLIDFNISIDGEESKDIQGISQWYAAPEQYQKIQNIWKGQNDRTVLDGRMDIYSLGAVFYRLMTGYLPTPQEDISRYLRNMQVPYSDGLKAVVVKMIRYSPRERFSNAGKVKKALWDISKMDPLYKRYGYVQVLALLGWGICLFVGILCLYYGNWKHVSEHMRKEYTALYKLVEERDETEIVAQGIEILNDSGCRSYFKENPEKKADILNQIGESYYRQEQYEEAVKFYKDAWKSAPTEEDYCKNYVAALIKDGQIDLAKTTVEKKEVKRILDEDVYTLIMTEIAWADWRNESLVEELLLQANNLERAGKTETAVEAYRTLADIYDEQKQYEKAVEVLEMASRLEMDKDVLRQLGEISYHAAETMRQKAYRDVYLEKACQAYLTLEKMKSPSYEDLMNLALVERALEKYENSNQTLKKLEKMSSDAYEVPMWICFNYINIEKEGRSYRSVMSDLKWYYEKAQRLYQKTGGVDHNMEDLMSLMKNLEE